MSGGKASPGHPLRIVSGVLLLARFRAAGFDLLGDTRQAFLTSLAPLLAFPLVGLGLNLIGGGNGAVSDFLMTVAAVLAPPVISHTLAALWAREALWLRFAIAFNWCQCIIPFVMVLVFTGFSLAWRAGVPAHVAAMLALLVLVAYGLTLHFFLARRGLDLPVGRSVVLVLMINLGTAAVILIPRLLAGGVPAAPG